MYLPNRLMNKCDFYNIQFIAAGNLFKGQFEINLDVIYFIRMNVGRREIFVIDH